MRLLICGSRVTIQLPIIFKQPHFNPFFWQFFAGSGPFCERPGAKPSFLVGRFPHLTLKECRESNANHNKHVAVLNVPRQFMKFLPYTFLIVLMSAAPAFASVTVNSPQDGESVTSPFDLEAYATVCSNQPIVSMGYSLGNSSDTTILKGTSSIHSKVSASLGTQTLHVKSWGNRGAVCVTDVAIQVTRAIDDPAADASVVPLDAVSVSSIQTLNTWNGIHDSGTSGYSSGKMSLVGSPSHTGIPRAFVSTYSNGGGVRYWVSFGDDQTATNFLYDGWVYLTSSAGYIGNLEMDMNQTMPNGQTVIFGVQCDGYSSTWDYTENLGTPEAPKGHWAHSTAGCNPRSWSRDAWHHVEITYSRTNSGMVTYKSVWLDGVESAMNATVPSAFALGWGPTLLTNFQVDGLGASGSSTVYLDDLTVYRW